MAIFQNGVPARITAADFLYSMLGAFPRLASPGGVVGPAAMRVVDDAIESVYDIFTGVNTLWSGANEEEWYDKATRCYLLLAAWYIADLYPRYAAGIAGTGGIPIIEKKIGDVMVKFPDISRLGSTDSVLEMLKSNRYGAKAYMMIKGAPSRFVLRVQSVTN